MGYNSQIVGNEESSEKDRSRILRDYPVQVSHAVIQSQNDPPNSVVMPVKINRREFQLAAATTIGSFAFNRSATSAEIGPLETFVPTRAITRGPKFHWFGYYDKREFDPSNRYVLTNQVEFEGRAPTGDDTITVGYVDTENGDSWHPIGTSNAWGWQQGCMLQWVGPNGDKILWNDRERDSFVCRVFDKSANTLRTIDRPIYTVTADGRFGLSVDFRRIDNLRPGYGYDGLADPHVAERAPEASGIWRVDLSTGQSDLIMSLAEVARIAWPDGKTHADAWHYFNHLLVNPAGDRFIVLHRYRPEFDPKTLKYKGGFVTRMLTANLDGSDRFVLDPSGYTSHFIWKDDRDVTMWTRPALVQSPDGKTLKNKSGFYVFTDRTRDVAPIGHEQMPSNGHNTYLAAPYQDWILNDTYPDRATSRQTVYLYHVPSRQRFDLGHFPSPSAYRGEWRCDTHPRSSDDGTRVAIDSPHAGGRQIYVLDIREILESV